MRLFVGTHQNRLDAKGRVSVPAPFRAALRASQAAEEPIGLMLRPSHKRDGCIECWPLPRFEELARTLDGLDPLSDEYDYRSASIFAGSTPVEMDKEGRIVLQPDMAERANLKDKVTFMGRGGTFEIWEPALASSFMQDATARMRHASLPRAPQ